MNFPENLKMFRKEKDMGQEALARLLKISLKTISHWETGYTEPSILQLCQLADIFEISIDELVGRIS